MPSKEKKNQRETPSRSRACPLFDGDDALRQAIYAVRRPTDCDGRNLPYVAVKLVVEKRAHWVLLPLHDLVQKKVSCLVDMALAHGLLGDMDDADLRALGRQIVAAARKPVVALRRSGYFRIAADGSNAEGFVWADCIHWAADADKSVRAICVVDGPVLQPPSCSLNKWNSRVGILFRGQRYMIVALGAVLSALLVRALDLSKLSLFVVGESSTGKSVLQRACLSAISSGADLEGASGTVLGLQMRMAQRPDQPVFIEDTRQLDNPAGLIKLSFDIGNGASRVVGSAGQAAIVGDAAHCVLIASNERTIAEGAAGRVGVQLDAGLGARIFELLIAAKHGVFDEIGKDQAPAEFAELISGRARIHFGALWPAWVEAAATNLAQMREHRDTQLPKFRRRLEKAANVDDPVSRRMINGYAGWMLALWLAAEYDLVPLTKCEIKQAFVSVLAEQQAQRVAGRTPLDEQILDAVRHAIDRNPKSFVPWPERGRVFNGMWGYTRAYDGEQYFLFLPSMLKEVVKGFGERDVLRTLERARYLKSNKGERTLSARLQKHDQPKRFYAISSRIRGDG
jgi:hypothetical protein